MPAVAHDRPRIRDGCPFFVGLGRLFRGLSSGRHRQLDQPLADCIYDFKPFGGDSPPDVHRPTCAAASPPHIEGSRSDAERCRSATQPQISAVLPTETTACSNGGGQDSREHVPCASTSIPTLPRARFRRLCFGIPFGSDEPGHNMSAKKLLLRPPLIFRPSVRKGAANIAPRGVPKSLSV